MARHTTASRRRTLRRSCARKVSKQISKEQKSRPNRVRSQNIAIAFSKVRKSNPRCKRFIRR